ncbi:hypothetical protein KEM52_004175, partial [Ascosphaera acerosa]
FSHLGSFEGEWLDMATPEIRARMAEYDEEEIEFAILSLARDPLITLARQLAANIKSIAALDARLGPAADDARRQDREDGTLTAPDAACGVTQEMLDAQDVPAQVREQTAAATTAAPAPDLLELRAELAAEQKTLRAAIAEEQRAQRADEEYTALRRHDYRPPVEKWLRVLAQKGCIEQLVAETTVN